MKKSNKIIYSIIGMLAVLGLSMIPFLHTDLQQKDDWTYDSNSWTDRAAGMMQKSASLGGMMAESMASSDMGFAVGGAKDINNFRENIENDFLPLPTDITYEGLFYDYYFDTAKEQSCDDLFCPSYAYALSKDPLSKEDEYYLTVGLNSNMKESDFNRKKLNLVVVLDISGSMGSSFDRYYYDDPSRQDTETKTKMEIATESIVAMLDHLNDDDRFGMVVFDDNAYKAKPVNLVGETDMDAIKDHILDITQRGSTNMEAGYEKATDMIEKYADTNQDEYETRIIFLTDAMPNTGRTDEGSLLDMTQENADDNIYTTFIGIGVDFNTELIEHITKIQGANYYSVHSADEFETRMDDEFEFMVTPLVFDLELQLEGDGVSIEKVYGSPEAEEATRTIMKVNTLFPSATEHGQTKGGIVLLKLKKQGTPKDLALSVTYKDRQGESHTLSTTVELGQENAEYFDNTGIRKGILLARYANLMKTWIDDERESYRDGIPIEPRVSYEKGIIIPPEKQWELSRWERTSIPLDVSPEYQRIFVDFTRYFEQEMDDIGDNTLQQEVEILNKLSKE